MATGVETRRRETDLEFLAYFVTDTRIEHFTSGGSSMEASDPAPDRKWTLVIQNQRDRDRLLKLLCRQWSEMHDGQELSVQVSS